MTLKLGIKRRLVKMLICQSVKGRSDIPNIEKTGTWGKTDEAYINKTYVSYPTSCEFIIISIFFTILYANTHMYEYAWYLGKNASNTGGGIEMGEG